MGEVEQRLERLEVRMDLFERELSSARQDHRLLSEEVDGIHEALIEIRQRIDRVVWLLAGMFLGR